METRNNHPMVFYRKYCQIKKKIWTKPPITVNAIQSSTICQKEILEIQCILLPEQKVKLQLYFYLYCQISAGLTFFATSLKPEKQFIPSQPCKFARIISAKYTQIFAGFVINCSIIARAIYLFFFFTKGYFFKLSVVKPGLIHSLTPSISTIRPHSNSTVLNLSLSQ